MDSYAKFAAVAAVTVLIGVPLWITVIAPEMGGFSVFLDPGFWFVAAIGMVILLVSFWGAQRSDL